MFILRTIEETREDEKAQWSQFVSNLELGNCYTVHYPESKFFIPLLQSEFPDEDIKNVRAIITPGSSTQLLLLTMNTETLRHEYFIMTDSGRTFERL